MRVVITNSAPPSSGALAALLVGVVLLSIGWVWAMLRWRHALKHWGHAVEAWGQAERRYREISEELARSLTRESILIERLSKYEAQWKNLHH